MTASLFSYLQPGNSGQDTNFTANLNSVCRRNFPNWIFSPRSRSPELSRRPERAKAPSELISRSPNTQKPVPSTSCAQIQDLQRLLSEQSYGLHEKASCMSPGAAISSNSISQIVSSGLIPYISNPSFLKGFKNYYHRFSQTPCLNGSLPVWLSLVLVKSSFVKLNKIIERSTTNTRFLPLLQILEIWLLF